MQKQKIDFVVHIPLEEEYLQFRDIFPVMDEVIDGLNVIATVKAPSAYTMAVIVQEKMGRSSSAAACQKILSLYEPLAYICLGIAGGLSKDLELGDVCYTGNMIDVYDNSKITDAEGGGVDIALSPDFYETDRRITAGIGFVRTLSSLSDLHNFWKEDQENFARQTCPTPVLDRDGKDLILGAPKCKNGYLVCGAVSESEAYRNRLKGVTRNILAIETESGPVFEHCAERGIPAITIRGISDYANKGKSELEGSTKDAVRTIAARNAATFLHMQLQSRAFIDAIGSVCHVDLTQPRLELPDSDECNIPFCIEKISAEVDLKLRELSPQYRTKPLGFKLPSPRLKSDTGSAASDSKRKPEAREFITTLARHRRMLLYVPRTYPDQALPWVLAGNLLDADIAGKKAIPIVIDGRKLGPPKDTFEHIASLKLNPDIAKWGGEYVFIIIEPPFSSKTRVSYLAAELKVWENSRVVFITRSDKTTVESSEFARQLSIDPFSLSDVSFSEMALFLETSFLMPSQEAEVVALKLKGMFSRFSLPAHPSFFAGIPPEALSALLMANRRSELIQLAVDGFLSFVVASDTETVRMSRTNRAKFLRRLTVDIVYEKKRFSEAELVQYAKDVSDEYDYGLNPISFIKSFSDAGLISFEDGRAFITLPFVQSYLFADEINKQPELASNYMRSVGPDLDLSIFDLYSEIGPSEAIIDTVMNSLKISIEEFGDLPGDHILLTGSINPVVFKNPARLTNLSQKVSEARSAVAEGASHRDEKARILDIADRVNEDVAEQSLAEPDEPKNDNNEGIEKISDLLEKWNVATILLGSGAESIVGQNRQELARLIIVGGERLLEGMLRHFSGINFEEIKSNIAGDENFRKELGAIDDADYDNIVSALVDLVEFVALSQPLDRVFDQLPDRANHKIVANSVAKAETTSTIQELIKLNWLTNNNALEGRGKLIKAIAALPKVHFLRATLTSIFLQRAKWKLPDHDTRMALIDSAEAAIKPYNPNFEKGEIIRFVERHVPSGSDADADDNGS